MCDDILKAWKFGPKVFEFEWCRPAGTRLIHEKKRAVVPVGGGESVQGASVEGQVPVLVAEDSVKANKSGVAPLVAPRELSILEVDFLQVAVIERAPEPRHEARVKVSVVFISCFVNQIVVSDDAPPRCVCRFQASHVPEEGILFWSP
jgi:hypothetical protein